MTLLEVATDPLAFENWVQITALLILVVGGLGWRYMSVISTNAKATSAVVNKIDASLSTNNSGSHIKDQLDRLEENQAVITHNQAEIIKTQTEQGTTLTSHVQWSDSFAAEQKAMHEKLDEALDCQEKKLEKMWKTVSPTTPE